MIRKENKWLILAVILILAGGAVLVMFTAQTEDNRLRQDLLTKTRFMERGIRYEQVENLTGSKSDLSSADYIFLKWQMQQMRSADPHIRFTYLVGKRPDGNLIFLVDSEPPDSDAYSEPGQVYREASSDLVSMFDSPMEITGGPFPDRWGTWISALVPLISPSTGKVIAVYGIDVDAVDWIRQIIITCIPVTVGVLLIVLLVLVFTNIRRRDRREKEILEISERALRESERRLTDIINFLPDPTFAIDLDGRVIAWNKAMEELTGVTAGAMLGKGDYEYSLPFYGEKRPLLINLIHEPDDIIARYYTNIVHEKDFLIADTTLPRLKGRTVALMVKAGPLYDHDGNIAGAIEAIRDMTFRKAAEDALVKSEERFRVLLQNVNDGIIVNELSTEGLGKILDANDRACLMLGYRREELLNLTIRDIDVPEHWEKNPFIIHELTSKKHTTFETGLIRKDGKQVAVEISARLFEVEGKFRVLAAFRDITERKHVEKEMARHTTELRQYAEALSQTNNKLNLMNSIMRHDILNQITAITGYLDLVKNTVSDPSIKAYIDPALCAADNIKKYIRFSKEYQEIGIQSPRWFTVRNLVQSAAAGLTLSPVKLIMDLGSLEIFADPLLEKVYYTLLENGLRHGDGLTMIRFFFLRSGGNIVIVYEDDGPGVPPEYKMKIFEREYYRHTGYGLFLSREILAITGITISETGEYLKGARFEITVPEGAFRFTDVR